MRHRADNVTTLTMLLFVKKIPEPFLILAAGVVGFLLREGGR